MRRALAAAACALALAAPARAADPTPEQVLARAQEGRVPFLRAIADVARFAPRLPRKELLYPYLVQLDALAAIGRRHGFDGLGMDPVRDLGLDLTSEAEKWIRLDSDAPEVIGAFLKWSSNDVRFTLAGDSALFVAGAETPEALLAWDRGARDALVRLRALKAERAVLQSFEELQGAAVRELLRDRTGATPSQVAQAVAQTRSVPGIQELLADLDLRTEEAGDADARRRLLDWSIALSSNARTLGAAAPARLRADAGAVVLETLTRMLGAGDAVPPEEAAGALAALFPSQRATLLAELVDLAAEREPSPAESPGLRALAEGLEKRLPAATAPGRARDFERLRARLAGVR